MVIALFICHTSKKSVLSFANGRGDTLALSNLNPSLVIMQIFEERDKSKDMVFKGLLILTSLLGVGFDF